MNQIVDELIDSTSSSSEDEAIGIITNVIAPELLEFRSKTENFVETTVRLYTDEQFVSHFRLTRNTVAKLAWEFENSHHYPKKDTGHDRISSYNSLLCFLWFAANEAGSYRDVADRFNVSTSTLHCVISRVISFLSGMSSRVIVWPQDEERSSIAEDFNRRGFPGVVGCIDGTHFRIDSPREDSDSYLNRKKFHSIQMQLVCDSRKRIRDVFIGFPGSVHDARVFRNSPLFQNLEAMCGENFIIGDSAYPCLRNLLTPYKETGNLSPAQRNYNKVLSHNRVLIEHTIGILKQKFRQLYHLKMKNIDMTCHFIRACCVLHNLCIDEDFEFSELPNFETEERREELSEAEGNEVGFNYRNYIAAMLNI